MAEQGGGNLGDISYSVSADTEGLLVSAKQVDSATKGMANSFQELTKKIAGTESGSSKLAAQFGGAGKAAAALENEIKRLGGQVQANGNVVDQYGVRNAKLTSTLGSLRGATFQTTSSFRMMRGGIQQIGYQIQDVAVQLQMGQNALMVLGQQGSQVASIFGKGGAVFGAVLAVSAALGTAMMPALFNSKSATEELEEALESLNKVIENKDGVIEFTDELRELAKQSEVSAQALAISAIANAENVASKAAKAIADLISESSGADYGLGNIEDITAQYALAGSSSAAWQEISKELGEELGQTGDNARKAGDSILSMLLNLRQKPSKEGFEELRDTLGAYIKDNDNVSSSIQEMYTELVRLSRTGIEAAESQDWLKKALNDLDGQLAASTKLTKDATNSYASMIGELSTAAATTGMSAREQALYNAEIMLTSMGKLGELEATKKLINGLFDEIEAKQRAADATKDQTEAHNKARESLDKLIQTTADKMTTTGLEGRELAKHTALQLIASQGLDVNTDAVLANIDAMYDRIEAKNKEIKSEKDAKKAVADATKEFERYEKSLKSKSLALESTEKQREAFINELVNQASAAGKTKDEIENLAQGYRSLWAAEDRASAEDKLKDIEKEIQLQMLKNSLTEKQFELQSALMLLGEDANKMDENGVTYGERLQEAIEKMQELRFQAELLGQDLQTTFQDIGIGALDSFSDSIANSIVMGEDLSESLKNVARSIITELLSAIIRYYVGKAAAALLGSGVEAKAGIAAQAANATAAVAAGSAITAAYAPAALAANVASFGGAATAAALTFPIAANSLAGSMGAVAAFGSAISGMGGGLLYGGATQAGKMHPILEDGKPEMLTMGNKNYLMTPQSGIVTSNKDLNRSVSTSNNNINLSLNMSPNTPQDFRRQLFENQELIYSVVQKALNDRGRNF